MTNERRHDINPGVQSGSVATETGFTVRDAIGLAYHSYNRAKPMLLKRRDCDLRHPEWTRRLLDAFGAPDTAMFNVAVTGSKGKGSHAILLAGILEKLGLTVGLFTGPHLVDFMERFRINGQTIPEDQFVAYMQTVFRQTTDWVLPEGHYFGPVGLLAVVACLWFQASGTDVNVIECGRGALHDDVNQLRHQGAVVAPVFVEHARELGPTLEDIAHEKAGVVTEDVSWVATYTQSDAVRRVFESEWRNRALDVRELNRHYATTWQEVGDTCVLNVDDGQRSVRIVLPLRLCAFADNVAVAWDAAVQVYQRLRPGKPLPDEIDLQSIRLPGRLDVIRDRPLTVIDGTIHEASATRVASWLQTQLQRRRQTIGRAVAIMSMPDDKDGLGVVRALAPFIDTLITTKAHNPHLVFSHQFSRDAQQFIPNVLVSQYIEDAAELANALLTPDDCLLLLGTQSFVGDALRHFEADSRSIWQHPPCN